MRKRRRELKDGRGKVREMMVNGAQSLGAAKRRVRFAAIDKNLFAKV